MFYDLNIKRQNVANWESPLELALNRLVKFGYRYIALTTDVNEDIFTTSKQKKEYKVKAKENTGSVIPSPICLKNLKTKFPKVKFLNRINIIISDSSNIRKFIQFKEIKKFDLISFQPENQAVLKSLTGFSEVDIISYNPESKSDISFNRKLYNQFVSQNVYFEIIYSPAIIDTTARKNLLMLSHLYKAVGKSKNIIVSSGTQFAAHVRGPYDVINFSLLFGLSEEQSKSSITSNCQKVILRANKRRRNKSTIEIDHVKTQGQENENDRTWRLKEKVFYNIVRTKQPF